jgi:hypothetical protein
MLYEFHSLFSWGGDLETRQERRETLARMLGIDWNNVPAATKELLREERDKADRDAEYRTLLTILLRLSEGHGSTRNRIRDQIRALDYLIGRGKEREVIEARRLEELRRSRQVPTHTLGLIDTIELDGIQWVVIERYQDQAGRYTTFDIVELVDGDMNRTIRDLAAGEDRDRIRTIRTDQVPEVTMVTRFGD